MPAFAPLESPEDGDSVNSGAEEVVADAEVDDVGVDVAGAFHRARSLLCHAI